MLVLKMRFTVSAKKRDEFSETVGGLLERIRVEEGCMECRLRVDVEDARDLTLVEGWRDEEAFARHIRGKSFRTLLVAMDLLEGPPDIRIIRPTGQRMIDSVKELYTCSERTDGDANARDAD